MGTSSRWIAGLGLGLVLALVLRWALAGARAVDPASVAAPARAATPARVELEGTPAPRTESRTPVTVPGAMATTNHETTPDSGSGVVLGRILVPAGRARDFVDLQLVPEQPGKRFAHEFAWQEDGAFRYGQLAPGLYRLELYLWGNIPGTHTIRGIQVRAGETITLEPIELEALLHVVLLDVRDESGGPVPDASVWLELGPPVGWSQVPTLRDRDGALLLRSFEARPERLRVGAPGFLMAELEHPRPSERVVLLRGPRVHLRLHGGLPPLPAPWRLLVNVVQDEAWELASPATFDALGQATLALSRGGAFHVGLLLQHPSETGHHGLNGLDWWIEVEAAPGEHVFTSPPFSAAFLDDIARQTSAPR